MTSSTIDQVKLAMMDGIEARIMAVHNGVSQCANKTGIEPELLYRITSRDTARCSMHRLVMIAEILGGKIRVTVE